MAENSNTNAEKNKDQAEFAAFLNQAAKTSSEFSDWERRILGGGGGYQSQAHTTQPSSKPTQRLDLK